LLSNEVSGNKDTLRFGPFKGLSPGKHKISVVESVFGCDPDTSNFIEITINNALDTKTPQIDASRGVICTDGSISFTISKTAKGDEYRLYDGSQLLITRTSKDDLEVLKYGPLFNLSSGLHTFYGTITNPGCGTFPMVDSVNVLVNPPPDENTKVTSNSPICVNQAVTFTVQKADSVLYSLYSAKPLKLVAGPDSSKLKTKVYTVAQTDSFYVAANIAGCETVWLNPMQKITVNDFPTESLKASDFTACGNDSAVIILSTPTTTNAYIASLGSKSISLNGPGVLSYKFETNNLISDSNSVGFQVFVPGCNYKTIATSTIFKISPHSGSSSAAVCENDMLTLSVPKIKGVDSSVWVVPNGVKTISVDNDTATFKWGLKNTEGKIVVYPVGSTGKCSLYADTINVTVFEKTKGTADYIQIDTLCVGAIDTISLVDLLGVLKDSLIPANGVTILEVITNATEFNKYVVQYKVSADYVHQYYIESPCGTDTVIKSRKVVVLPNPVADAGMYPVYDMLYFPREVVLDGSNSSKGKFLYTWKTIPSGNVSNPSNIVASFVPEQPSTVVELSVTNLNGMCSSIDTAIVNVSLGIFIPNVFTPNNDGDHDQWLLENVQSFYPNVSVDIYSKWGTHVYHSNGYSKPWDGKRNGEDLPSATYYYVIDLKKPNFKPVAGSVTILR
jgi:gliding motility-associated-like protein